MGTRWRGMLAPLGVSTGDGRRFLASGVTHRELPLALKWQREDEPGHDNSVVVGMVDMIIIEDDGVWGEGELFDDVSPQEMPRLAEDVSEAKLLLDKKVIGPSVDAGAVEAVLARVGSDEPLSEDELDQMYWDEMETGEKAPIEVLFTEYEISAATLVTIPAFAECRPFEMFEEALTAAIRRTGWDFPFGAREAEWDGAAAEKRVADDAGIGGESPDWSRYAQAFLYREDDADPELKGTYGFQIVDLVDGERVIMPRAVFTVAGVLQGSMGGTNIPDQDQQDMKEVAGSLYERMAEEFDDDTIVAPWDASTSSEAACNPKRKRTTAALVNSLTAAATTKTYDLAAFAPPEHPIDGLVNITVTDDRRVFGHIATHDVCHIGIPGVCMTAPVDLAGFDRFHRYPITGSDGEPIAVGRITFGNGRFVNNCECCRGNDDHACAKMSMGGAIAHHDQMSTVAWVRAYEDPDNNAIVVSGVLADGVTPQQIKALARGRVSGDWRSVGGELPLVEILTLHREMPGFPLPRARMSGSQMMSLTAAGTVGPTRVKNAQQLPTIDYERLSTLIADKLSTSGIGAAPAGSSASVEVDTTDDNDQAMVEASGLVGELGLIFAGRDEAEALRLVGEVERITHVLR